MPIISRGYRTAIAVSVTLHLLLVIAVIFGWQASTEQSKTYVPRYIEAKLVQVKATTPTPKKASKPKPKKIDMAAKRREQERLRKLKAEKQRKIDLAKKKAQQDKKKKLAEQKKKEQALKEQQQRERELAQQQQLQRELDEALLEEEELLEAETQAEMAQSYSALIAQRVRENWSRPPSARNGMQCVLLLHLVPSGEVVDVSVVDGSGNGAFDRSAEQAVRRVGRFDELQGMPSEVFEQNFRRFRMKFNPQDLRL